MIVYFLKWNLVQLRKEDTLVYELQAFFLEHDENKINKFNQYLAEKKDHVMPTPAYFRAKFIRWISLCIRQQNDSLSLHFSQTHKKLHILYVITVGSTVSGRPFSYIRQIDNWLCNSMLTDLLEGLLAFITVHGHTILIRRI